MRNLLPAFSVAVALAAAGCAVHATSRPSAPWTPATYTIESPTLPPAIDTSVAVAWARSWWTAPTATRVDAVRATSTRQLADTLARALPTASRTPCRTLRTLRDYTNRTAHGTLVVVTALCQHDRDIVAVALTLLLVTRDGHTLVEAVA